MRLLNFSLLVSKALSLIHPLSYLILTAWVCYHFSFFSKEETEAETVRDLPKVTQLDSSTSSRTTTGPVLTVPTLSRPSTLAGCCSPSSLKHFRKVPCLRLLSPLPAPCSLAPGPSPPLPIPLPTKRLLGGLLVAERSGGSPHADRSAAPTG